MPTKRASPKSRSLSPPTTRKDTSAWSGGSCSARAAALCLTAGVKSSNRLGSEAASSSATAIAWPRSGAGSTPDSSPSRAITANPLMIPTALARRPPFPNIMVPRRTACGIAVAMECHTASLSTVVSVRRKMPSRVAQMSRPRARPRKSVRCTGAMPDVQRASSTSIAIGVNCGSWPTIIVSLGRNASTTASTSSISAAHVRLRKTSSSVWPCGRSVRPSLAMSSVVTIAIVP